MWLASYLMTKFNMINRMLQIVIGVTVITAGLIGTQSLKAAQLPLGNDSQNSTDSEIIFDNGSPNLTAGRETTLWIQAEDFLLNQDTTLKNIKFWTLEPVDAIWDGTIKYSLFDNINDKPDTTALAAGSGVNIHKIATGRKLYDNYNEFGYSFNLENLVNLQANRKYWLGLHLSSNFDRDNIYWETTDTGYGINGTSAYLGDVTDWSRSSEGAERAFQLSSTSNLDGQPVPEPTTMLSSLVALGIGTALRRMKSK